MPNKGFEVNVHSPLAFPINACNQLLLLTWDFVTWKEGHIGVDGNVVILRVLEVSSDMLGAHVRTC